MTWTVTRIKTKIRRLTGRLSTNQLSENELLNYINDFYTEKLLAELNLPERDSWYEFNTTKNDEDYSIQSTDYTYLPPVYVNGTSINFYTDPGHFFSDYPHQYDTGDLDTGDGSTVTFTGTLGNTPLKAGKLVVTDNTETFTDNSDGTLTGDAGGSGTISYTSGAVSVTFNAAPTDGTDIEYSYEYFDTAAPTGILYYKRELVLRPVPDTVYQIKIKTSTKPTAFTQNSDTPTYNDWGPLLAYGAAIDILSDYEGPALANELIPEYRRRLDDIETRRIRQLEDSRADPTF
ncbi:MAG: hypothetical protein ACFFG0_04380 [Candidatus Thorarchaeota archaeon]